MGNSGGWLQGIQYLRAIAVMEVIMYHVAGAGAVAPNPLWIVVAVTAVTSFGVPLFVFISGLVLYNKYNNGFSVVTFYKKRLSSVVPPYIVWTTFWFVIILSWLSLKYAPPIALGPGATFPYMPAGWSASFATIASDYAAQLAVGILHLWFVRVLIVLYLLYPILEKLYNRTTRQNNPIYILAVFLLAQIACTSLAYSLLGSFLPSPGQCLVAFGAFGYVLFYVYYALVYVFYFVFGFFISQHYEAMKRSIAKLSLKTISLAVLAATIYYTTVFYYGVGYLYSPAIPLCAWLNLVTAPFYCLLLILFYLRICTAWGEPRGLFLSYLEKIGEDSFGIYLINFLFLGVTFVPLWLLGLTLYNLVLYPLWFLLTLVLSYVAVEAIYHLPFSNIIIGGRRRKKSQASVDSEPTLTHPAS
jgi:probable poly-beta-1,6-N-acetyl-D-glucosamine export protein